jgi:peptide/nickel transport system ATP-binding protein
MSSVPLLAARGLVKRFPLPRGSPFAPPARVHALNGVDLTVHEAETLGIVGESGCGKSTLARVLMRMMPPDEGEVTLRGRPAAAMPRRAFGQTMQMVFQDSGGSLNPRATARETVALGLRAAGQARGAARDAAEGWLRAVGLDPARFAERYPHEMSGGQRQRVNIARAIAVRPALLILDEAVSALDKSVEAQILNLLTRLRSELGLAYLLISHDLAVVHYLSDRVAVMYLGRVVESGPTEAVYRAPRHPYTRALLAAMPGQGGATRDLVLQGDPPSPVRPPSGCAFHPRCAVAAEVCRQVVPALAADGTGAAVACHAWVSGSSHGGRLP